jgi:hypothetical protein
MGYPRRVFLMSMAKCKRKGLKDKHCKLLIVSHPEDISRANHMTEPKARHHESNAYHAVRLSISGVKKSFSFMKVGRKMGKY